MEVHDLRHYVGQYLDQPSALACILVSKDWLASFQPFVYQKVKLYFIDEPDSVLPEKLKMPTLRNLNKYGPYIREMTLQGYTSDDFAYTPPTRPLRRTTATTISSIAPHRTGAGPNSS